MTRLSPFGGAPSPLLVLVGHFTTGPQHGGSRALLRVCPMHAIQDRWQADEVGESVNEREKLVSQPHGADRERHEQGYDQPDPEQHDHSLYRRAAELAHSATIVRASAGSTTVATPGILAMSLLRPW